MAGPTLELELGAEDVSDLIGEQLIMEREGEPFSYLAGLAFDGMTSEYDIVDILVEYINNEKTFAHVSREEAAEIEEILREEP